MLFEKLIDSERFAGLGQLAGNVTQQLNSPLTVILGYASLLEDSSALEVAGPQSGCGHCQPKRGVFVPPSRAFPASRVRAPISRQPSPSPSCSPIWSSSIAPNSSSDPSSSRSKCSPDCPEFSAAPSSCARRCFIACNMRSARSTAAIRPRVEMNPKPSALRRRRRKARADFRQSLRSGLPPSRSCLRSFCSGSVWR